MRLYPSDIPSTSPSDPTFQPTSAPVPEICFGLIVEGTNDELSGVYSLQNDTYNGYLYWIGTNQDNQIYFSDLVYHQSWIITSSFYGIYWLGTFFFYLESPF